MTRCVCGLPGGPVCGCGGGCGMLGVVACALCACKWLGDGGLGLPWEWGCAVGGGVCPSSAMVLGPAGLLVGGSPSCTIGWLRWGLLWLGLLYAWPYGMGDFVVQQVVVGVNDGVMVCACVVLVLRSGRGGVGWCPAVSCGLGVVWMCGWVCGVAEG